MTGSGSDRIDSFVESAYERLEAAEIMLDNGHYIDSVNRSYYAMYNMAMAALTLKEVHTKTHKGLHTKFHELFIRTDLLDIIYGKYLNRAETVRGKCDYNPSMSITKELAEDIYQKAADFMQEVNNLIGGIRS